MKLRLLLLSFLSLFLFATPAQAGKLIFWRFDSGQNRLVFTTNSSVQPRAQLIPNPTRIVIDLPGTTLGSPTVNQAGSGYIKSIRVGQFDASTARLVIEMIPGYTVDPQQVKVRGASPTQWTVELPPAIPVSQAPVQPPITTPPPTNTTPPPITTPTETPPSNPTSSNQDFKITQNGLFVNLSQQENPKIKVDRSKDKTEIEFSLKGATLPGSISGQTLPVNTYGVTNITFEQKSAAEARIVLQVSRNSPDWKASFSRTGGLVLFPEGGIPSSGNTNSNIPPTTPISTNPTKQLATIESVDLMSNGTQLLIKADQNIQAQGNFNRGTGFYEITINNAKLADPVRGPQLNANSPVYRLRLRQQDPDTVLIMVQPAVGVRIEELNQPSNQYLALQLRRISTGNTANNTNNQNNNTQIPINSQPPSNYPPANNANSGNLPNVPNGRFLVVIDPGHGGKDPGAIGIGGLQEKGVLLMVSQEVSNLLQQKGVRVIMTRDSDYFVSLEGRTQMANSAKATLFVSIHANSINLSRTDVNGLETYYYGSQSGQKLAQTIHNSILRQVNIRDRGVRTARYYVLRHSNMPSTLIEIGFVTGAEDAANLQNPTWRSQMAAAIANGILEYLNNNY